MDDSAVRKQKSLVHKELLDYFSDRCIYCRRRFPPCWLKNLEIGKHLVCCACAMVEKNCGNSVVVLTPCFAWAFLVDATNLEIKCDQMHMSWGLQI